jgi:hypothetical protein
VADIFTFPSVDEDRNRITIIRTPRPTWDDARIHEVSAAFAISEQERQDNAGPRLALRDSQSELEIFRTSDSLRWTLLANEDQEPAEPPDLPTEEEAVRVANEQLARRGLADQNVRLESVTFSHHSRIGRGNEVLANYPVAKHVNYRYALHGLPVFGPGAKIQVTFASKSRPAQMYRFWRQPAEGRTVETIGFENAVEQIRDHKAFRTMREGGKAQIRFERVRLGYYALPAREIQGMLIPVYRFEGGTHPPEGENYRFVRHVVAVNLPREEVKLNRLPARYAPPAVFSA